LDAGIEVLHPFEPRGVAAERRPDRAADHVADDHRHHLADHVADALAQFLAVEAVGVDRLRQPRVDALARIIELAARALGIAAQSGCHSSHRGQRALGGCAPGLLRPRHHAAGAALIVADAAAVGRADLDPGVVDEPPAVAHQYARRRAGLAR